jgi:CRISPR/Cas system-associated endonuclease Cas3-HD
MTDGVKALVRFHDTEKCVRNYLAVRGGQQHELTSASENVPEGYLVGGFTCLTWIT